jgi:hypothetical protein
MKKIPCPPSPLDWKDILPSGFGSKPRARATKDRDSRTTQCMKRTLLKAGRTLTGHEAMFEVSYEMTWRSQVLGFCVGDR